MSERFSKQAAKDLRAKGLKRCPICEKALPFSEFGKNCSACDGLTTYCKRCKRERENHDYQQTKHERKAQRDQRKQELVGLLGGVCTRCGFNEFPSALDFHHICGEDKEHQMATIVAGSVAITEQALVDELDKCALLCRNCHGAYHAAAWHATWQKRQDLGWTLANRTSEGLGSNA